MSSSTANSNSSSSSLPQLRFTVQDGERPGLLREFETFSRIERLFSVQLNFGFPPSHQEQQGEWVILTGCEENNFKAKRYITALCIPETKLMVNSGGPMFTDLLSLGRDSSGSVCDELEYQYQVAISPSPNGAGMLVKGAQSDVYRVAERLSMDTSTKNVQLPSRGAEVRTREPPHSHNFQSTTSYMPPNPVAINTEVLNSTPCSQDLDQQLRNALQKGVETFPEHLKKVLLQQLVGQNNTEQHLPTQNSHPIHNSVVISRAPDQAREQRIENFIRLDYPRQKVEAVIDSLGVSAADDAILARLVRVCATSSTNHQKVKSLSTCRPRSKFGEPVMPSVVVPCVVDPSQLRHIVIDGSNVAMSHGKGRVFSCRGIQLAVDYFKNRGHEKITVFVPEWRKEMSRPETPITDQEILYSLMGENMLTFTPSRRVKGKRIVCYDDRFIVRLAHKEGGVILSNDQFRDLIEENSDWRDVIEQRLIQFSFVDDLLMIPDDPLGRHGPTLDQLLQKDFGEVSAGGKRRTGMDKTGNLKICPYLETGCTFGRKCKFYHPDREQPSSGTGSKTPGSSRSATPSPSPEKSLAYKQSNEDLKPPIPSYSGYTDDSLKPSSGEMPIHSGSSQPTIDISSVSDVLGRMSLQNSPHKHSSESAQSYPTPFSQQQQQQQQQFQQPTYTSKPNYISLSPPQPQDYSRSSPALTSETPSFTPIEDIRPHMHTFPMATLHQSNNTRQHRVVTEDLTKHQQPTTAFGPPIPPPETPDPPSRMQRAMDPQYNMPPSSHLLPRGFDPRISPYPPESYPQQYGGNPARGFSPPYHPSQPGASYPKRPMPDGIQHGAHRIQQPSKSISYPIFEPHPQYHQEPRHLGGRRSLDYGTLPSQNFGYQGDGYQHHQHHHQHQRRMTSDPVQMRTSVPSYNMSIQSQSSGGHHPLPHSHSFSQLSSHQSRLPGVHVSEAAVYYPPAVSSSGQDGMRYAPPQHQQQQFHPNQSEFEPVFNEALFRKLVAVFPGCEDRIRRVMLAYPKVTEYNEFQKLLNQMN